MSTPRLVAAKIVAATFQSADFIPFPAFTVPPDAVSVTGHNSATVLALGDTVNMDCTTCNGNPAPLLRWTEKTTGTELASSFAEDVNGCTNVSLVLGPLTEEFNGREYECYAANGINPDKWDSRTLTIECELARSYETLLCLSLYFP